MSKCAAETPFPGKFTQSRFDRVEFDILDSSIESLLITNGPVKIFRLPELA